MGKGLSMWIFSKVVMLIFLFAVFGMVVGFLKMAQEKVMVDSAEGVTLRVKSAVENMVSSSVSANGIYVAIPRKIPEESGRSFGAEGSLISRPYTLAVSSADVSGAKLFSVALSFDNSDDPETYAASSSFFIPLAWDVDIGADNMDSLKTFYVYVGISGEKLCISNCSAMGNCGSGGNPAC